MDIRPPFPEGGNSLSQGHETQKRAPSIEPVSSPSSPLNRNGSQEYHSQELDRPSFVNHPEDGLLQDSKKYPLQIWFNPSRDTSDSEPAPMSPKEESRSLSELRKNDPSPLTEEEVETQIKALELGWENAGKQFLDALNTIERFRTTSPTTREAVQTFIRAGEQFYGKELMQYALGEDYSGEKSTLSAERVQEILNKADTVIRNAVLFLRECPYIPSNTIQDLALHKEIQQELDAYKEAYQELGPQEQHLVATVYHALETSLRGIGLVGSTAAIVIAATAAAGAAGAALYAAVVAAFGATIGAVMLPMIALDLQPIFLREDVFKLAVRYFTPGNAATRTRKAAHSFVNASTLETKIKNLGQKQDKLSEKILQETGGAENFFNNFLLSNTHYVDQMTPEERGQYSQRLTDSIMLFESVLNPYLKRIDAEASVNSSVAEEDLAEF